MHARMGQPARVFHVRPVCPLQRRAVVNIPSFAPELAEHGQPILCFDALSFAIPRWAGVFAYHALRPARPYATVLSHTNRLHVILDCAGRANDTADVRDTALGVGSHATVYAS